MTLSRSALLLALALTPLAHAKPTPPSRAALLAQAQAQAAAAQAAQQGSQPGAPASPQPGSGPSAPAARPAPISAPWLDARAAENRDPELAEDRKAIEALRQEKALLEAELALAESKRRVELAPLNEERAKLEYERGLRLARAAARSAEIDAEKARLERRLAALSADASLKLAERNNTLRDLETDSRAIKAASELAIAKPVADSALRKARQEVDRIADAPDAYPLVPLIDGTLHISDRRIPFNGVVTNALADLVVSRIAFFNNKDATKPIFVVIDNSPGGSVFAELRILRAFESSKAPIIVVVKQAAASCAAITATLAPRSYCYPHTRILHHQMSTGSRGNMTQLRESLRFGEELYNRTFAPVISKLGYPDAAAFEKDMYKNASTGDWVCFGDEAAKRKWVDFTVERMVETGADELPVERPGEGLTPAFAEGCEMKRDASGRVYYQLPPLTEPGDFWAIDDPEGVFRP